ncbi:hypothetical protein KKE26_00565 [bacterium]|nr:hypothetical protein [bacterium]
MVVGLVGKDKSLEGQGWVLFLLKADECRCGGRGYAMLSFLLSIFPDFLA